MNATKNLLREEYEQLGGHKLSENLAIFLDKLWEIISKKKKSSIFEATIEAGFDEVGDDEMFIPLCERLLAMDLISAYSELYTDLARTITVDGSLREGISKLEDYDDSDKKHLGLALNQDVFVSVTILLGSSLNKKIRELEEKKDLEIAQEKVLNDTPAGSEEEIIESSQAASMSQEAMSDEEDIPEPELQIYKKHDYESEASQASKRDLGVKEEKVDAKDLPSTDLMSEASGKESPIKPIESEIDSGNEESNQIEAALEAAKEEAPSSSSQSSQAIEDDGASGGSSESVASGGDTGQNLADQKMSENSDELSSEEELLRREKAKKIREEIVSLGDTRARFKKYMIRGIGVLISLFVAVLAFNKSRDITRSTKAIEEHYETPAQNMRLVSIAELDALKQEMENIKAKNTSLVKEAQLAVEAAVAKAVREGEEKLTQKEKLAYEKGQSDALGLSTTLKERMVIQSATRAVINGKCEALGRGNRIDTVTPINHPLTVRNWIIDPASKKITGVEGVSEELLKRTDGPITLIRCYTGRADVWPSFDEPVIGQNGQAKPVSENGEVVETNPLLK